jgi:hypothetical protein
MSGETNLTDGMDTDGSEYFGCSGSESEIKKPGQQRTQSESFVVPLAPVIRTSSSADLKKKADGVKNGPGRPKKKPTNSQAAETEGEMEATRKVTELERMNEELVRRLEQLEERYGQREEENRVLSNRVSELAARVEKLEGDLEGQKKTLKNGTASSAPAPTFSSILKHKENEQLIKKMARSEVKAVDSIERNIVISGIKKKGNDEKEIKENDIESVNEVLSALQLRRDDVEFQKRIITRNETANIIIVKFKQIQYHSRALQNSSALKAIPTLKGIYINRDKTKAERIDEKVARDSAKEKNAHLTEIDQEGRRYGIDENGRKFYFGIRAGEVVKILRK